MKEYITRGKEGMASFVISTDNSGRSSAASAQDPHRRPGGERNPSVGMEVTYGFDDTAKGNRYLQIKVQMENRRESDFTGKLEILTTESSMEVYRYDYPVSLAALGQDEKIVYLPLGIKTDQLLSALRMKAAVR